MEIISIFSGSFSPLKNNIYYGVLLIKSEKFFYAISYGKSHFYLQRFADADFGLELAEFYYFPNEGAGMVKNRSRRRIRPKSSRKLSAT
jgi:hypothetical protein